MLINVSAAPNPHAAPSASKIGLIGSPDEISGPLAKKAPIIAAITPRVTGRDKDSSAITSAKVSGIKTLKDEIGETTPIRPVDNPA